MYKSVVRPLLFSLDAETAHKVVLQTGHVAQALGLSGMLRQFSVFEDAKLETELFGLKFKNPIGLAAGLDKNFEALSIWQALGFGFIEAGGVTVHPQKGNPRPRIFRLPQDQAIINRMGFPSEGLEVVVPRATRYHSSYRKPGDLLAINVAKTTKVSMDEAPSDFAQTFEALHEVGDLFIVDVSCPNTGEIAKLQEKNKLKEILLAIKEKNRERKPLLVKLGPDLSPTELGTLIEVCFECELDGIVATNTTSKREGLSSPERLQSQQGGLSGKPLFQRARSVVAQIYAETGGRIPIVAVGGISNCNDVVDMMLAGASLVQIYTALIYEGPLLVQQLKKDLTQFLNTNNLKSVNDLVGNMALKEALRV